MAKLVRIKGKITNQEDKPYTGKNGKPKTLRILTVVKEDGQKRTVASFFSQAKFINHYVEITAELKIEGEYKNYTLKTIKEQEGRASEEPVTDEEEIVSDEEVIEDDDSGTPTPSKKENDVDTEQGKGMDAVDIAEQKRLRWLEKDKRDIRSIVISYAKDLCVGGKIEKDKIGDTAEVMFNYVWNGPEKKK